MSGHILVTGGAGFIGSHTCKALAAEGFVPVAFDDLSRGHAAFVRWGPLVQGDILDPAALAAAFARYRPAAIIHFAALAYVGESVEQPLAYYRINVAGLINVLDAMLRFGTPTIVFSSSCATYGIPATLPVVEDAPQIPISPYGRSKLACEHILADVAAATGLAAACLRYFNAAGADPDGELVERHRPETHLIPLAIDAATGQGPPLSLLGTDYPTADGTANATSSTSATCAGACRSAAPAAIREGFAHAQSGQRTRLFRAQRDRRGRTHQRTQGPDRSSRAAPRRSSGSRCRHLGGPPHHRLRAAALRSRKM